MQVLPTTQDTSIVMFADNMAILSTSDKSVVTADRLQHHLNLLQDWTRKWRIIINSEKSAQITFTNRPLDCPQTTFNNIPIPMKSEIKYLRMHLDAKLNWSAHIKNKRKQIGLKVKEMYWLIGRRSQLSLSNKLLLCKTILKPIWAYGVQLWGCAKSSRTSKGSVKYSSHNDWCTIVCK